MKKPITIELDGAIPVFDFAFAIGEHGWELRMHSDGKFRVTKRRIRKLKPSKIKAVAT